MFNVMISKITAMMAYAHSQQQNPVSRFKALHIKPYVLPFDRKSEDGVMARKVLKFQRVGGVIINSNKPEDFRQFMA